ncbi:MAG: GIY-YIG nuclease family protein [Microbacterium sp.]
MAFTYILRCSDGTLYAGSTKDLALRIAQHSAEEGSRTVAKCRHSLRAIQSRNL